MLQLLGDGGLLAAVRRSGVPTGARILAHPKRRTIEKYLRIFIADSDMLGISLVTKCGAARAVVRAWAWLAPPTLNRSPAMPINATDPHTSSNIASEGIRAAVQIATPGITDRLLKIDEVAALIGMSPRWIGRQMREGRLPRVKLGSATRIRLSDAQRLIERGLQ